MTASRILAIAALLMIAACDSPAPPSARAANDLAGPGSRASFAAVDEQGKWAEIVVERGRTLDAIPDPRAQGGPATQWIEARATYVITADREGKPVGALADWYAYQPTARGMASSAILYGVAAQEVGRAPLPTEFGGVHAGDRLDGWFYVEVLGGDTTEVWLAFAQRETGENSWTDPAWDAVEKTFLLHR